MHILSSIQALDHFIAWWFHAHLTPPSSEILLRLSDPGRPECVGSITAFTGLLLTWKRLWQRLLMLGFALPGGMLVNEVVKETVQRARPFQSSPYLDLGGFSFPSAHTMAAALIYGALLVLAVSMIKNRALRLSAAAAAVLLVAVVSFSRVALGAHYLTDVLGAIAVSIGWLYFSHHAARKLVPAQSHALGRADDSETA